MPISQPTIPVKTFRFYFATDSAIRLSRFPGSAWRGAFGHALKKTVCVVRNTPCNECMLKTACAYSYIFETPPPADTEKMRKYTAAPHPFVLQFPLPESASGTIYRLDVILFGHGQRYFPYIIHAMQTTGRDGIGGHQQIFTLQKITDINHQGSELIVYQNGELKPQQPADLPEIPPMPPHVRIVDAGQYTQQEIVDGLKLELNQGTTKEVSSNPCIGCFSAPLLMSLIVHVTGVIRRDL